MVDASREKKSIVSSPKRSVSLASSPLQYRRLPQTLPFGEHIVVRSRHPIAPACHLVL
jgi:hypothetical protein